MSPRNLTGPYGDFEIDEDEVKKVTGNASDDIKALLIHLNQIYSMGEEGFGGRISTKIVFKEASILPKPEEPQKLEARVVVELDVCEGVLIISLSALD